MSWEDVLRGVIRKYRDGGGASAPDWVSRSAAAVERENAGCGDRVILYRSPGGEEMWVAAKGCAVCLAAAELLNRVAADVPLEKLPGIAKDVVAAFAPTEELPQREWLSEIPSSVVDDVTAFLPLRDLPGRRRCATLPWELLLPDTDFPG